MHRSDGYKGLIRWKHAKVASKDNKKANEMKGRQYGEVVDSFLATSGQLLEASMHERAFYMINSLVVSTGDLFDLSVMGFEPRISGVVSIRHSTLSAAGTFFDIRGAKLTEMATEPLSLFVQETVFAPPH